MLIINRIHNYLGLVRFSHTIFALPFALMSAIVAADGFPNLRTLLWILLCMVTARTSAMTFNRAVDHKIDALNPRTANRHIPAGKVSIAEAWGLWFVSSAIFIFSAYMLNPLCFYLSPFALFVVCVYSLCKRFTHFAHVVLGLALSIAPLGAWIAVTGSFDPTILLLSASVLCWVAGFDIIYALMDESFDRVINLHSMVVRYGRKNALRIAFLLHLFSVIFALLFGVMCQLGWIYYLGIAGFAALITYEHSIVDPSDETKINKAFFDVNAIISMGLLIFTTLDVMLT